MLNLKGLSYEKRDTIISLWITVVLGIGLMGYSIIRAKVLAFTHDESVTYNDYIWRPVQHIISDKYPSANNHIINTLLMKFCSWMFGNSELALRLPNVIAHFFFLLFSYSIVKRLSRPLFIVCGFILLNFNPFLLDFFSLARGYGLSISLIFGSIYFFLKYTDNIQNKSALFWSFFCAFFAVFSCFTMLLFYAALVGILFPITAINWKTPSTVSWKNWLTPAIITILMCCYSYTPISRLIEKQQFYYGGTNGFWRDTVNSLVTYTLYSQPYTETASLFIHYFLIITLTLMCLFFCFIILKKRPLSLYTDFIISFLFLMLPCIASLFQVWVTGSKYMLDRTALFLIPLYFLSFLFFMKRAGEEFNRKPIFNAITVLVTLFFFFNTLHSMNVKYCLIWKYDAATIEMLDDLNAQVSADNKIAKPINLGISWVHEPAINFYRNTKKLDWLNKVTREGVKGNFDYFFIQNEDSSALDTKKLTLVKSYESSNSILYKALDD